MKANCLEITSVLRILEASGNQVAEVVDGWSDVKEDLRMRFPLTSEVKEKIKLQEPGLEYWKYQGSPHNSPDEGFKCKSHGISITFPVEK
jgi:hypothetical protein